MVADAMRLVVPEQSLKQLQSALPGLGMDRSLAQVLEAMPADWRGTTFKNSELLGRAEFSERLKKLMSQNGAESAGQITTAMLEQVGNAEDYLRVASNISTMLEMLLAQTHGIEVESVFTFGSRSMPLLAVALTAGGRPVHCYHGDAPAPLADVQLAVLALLGGNVKFHSSQIPAANQPAGGGVVVACAEALPGWPARLVGPGGQPQAAGAAGVIDGDVLYVLDRTAISPADILVIRKRMATPATSPAAEATLRVFAGAPTTVEPPVDPTALAGFHAHLQTLSGTAVNPAANPVVFTAGLPALSSIFTALIGDGGADVVMCSTAYGGCSQLADLLHARAARLRKSTFDIQGEAKMAEAIESTLGGLRADSASLLPTTLLFVEIPTNPAMKVPELADIVHICREHRDKTGKKVVVLVDCTFAPNAQVLGQLHELAPELPALVFLSMSKSVSRGLTTAGAIVANHTREATELLASVGRAAAMYDTGAKPDQLRLLAANHTGVEDRCDRAYKVAVAVGDALRAAVLEHRGVDMPLAFVLPEHAARGFTSSTFSFNLPPVLGAAAEINAGLAQRFVDVLCTRAGFKPCVSFGQDNGMVYCTVPATSTQGAIKAEDKAKQAIGGVQLTRLSFPPSCDLEHVVDSVRAAVKESYSS